MARYIDIDKIIPELNKNAILYGWQGDMFISILENAEAEDVAPVIHAKWEYIIAGDNIVLGGICSNCKQESGRITKYCDKCGAIMDKENENE